MMRGRVMMASVVAVALVSAIPTVSAAEEAAEPSAAASATPVLHVALDGTGDFDSISAAVDAAQDGSEILVAPGTYVENVVINKDVTIRGQEREPAAVTSPVGAPMSCGPTDRPCALWLDESDATIEYLDIVGDADTDASVVVTGGAPILKRVSIEGDLDLREATEAVLRFVEVDGATVVRDRGSKPVIARSQLGSLLVAQPTAPTVFWNRLEHATLRGAANFVRNSVERSADAPQSVEVGVDVVDPAIGLRIRGNHIEGHPIGLRLRDATGMEFASTNALHFNGVGIDVDTLRGLDTSGLYFCKNDVKMQVARGSVPTDLRELCSAGG